MARAPITGRCVAVSKTRETNRPSSSPEPARRTKWGAKTMSVEAGPYREMARFRLEKDDKLCIWRARLCVGTVDQHGNPHVLPTRLFPHGGGRAVISRATS